MDIKASDVLKKSDTIYQSYNVKIANTIWSITYTHGKFNEVIVRKVSNNPWRTPGTPFSTFNEALDHYKSDSMKNALWETKFKFEIENNVTV